MKEFAHRDYADVALTEIGRLAGVTPGLVNHYFGTKGSLYEAVLRAAAERISTLVRTDLDHLDREQRVARNLEQFFDSLEHEREAWTLLFGARTRRDPAVVELVAEVRARTIDRMARNNAGDAEPSAQLLLALRIFQGAAESGATEWLSGRASRAEVTGLLRAGLQALLSAAE